MHFVVAQTDAAATKEHVEGHKELEEGYYGPHWNDIGRPEEEKGVEHVQDAKQMLVK